MGCCARIEGSKENVPSPKGAYRGPIGGSMDGRLASIDGGLVVRVRARLIARPH
jgi:hypothetical protein